MSISSEIKRIAQNIKAQEDYDDEVEFPGKYYMSRTYNIVTEESAEEGDYAETGWDLEDVEYDSLDGLLDDAEYDHSWVSWSSSHPGPHDWVISQEEVDFSSGDSTTYNLFIEKTPGPSRGPGLTIDEIKYISNRLGI